MYAEYKLRLVNLILASCALAFHPPYGPGNDDVVHMLGSIICESKSRSASALR